MHAGMHERHMDLWRQVIRDRQPALEGIHGPRHWVRVERNGLYLARETGADTDVVTLFALFHDSCRVNDGFDHGHGQRGAGYALTLRAHMDFLDDAAFEQLHFACTWHTELTHHADATIQTCFDADRLDLGRVGIEPHPQYLNTAGAKSLAGAGDLGPLHAEPTRDPDRLY